MPYYTISNYSDIYPSDEQNDLTEEVDETGYIDKNQYIAQMLAAGETLDELREGTYEYDDDDEPEIDPYRSGWIDPADIDQAAMGLLTKYNAQVASSRSRDESSQNEYSNSNESTSQYNSNSKTASSDSSQNVQDNQNVAANKKTSGKEEK